MLSKLKSKLSSSILSSHMLISAICKPVSMIISYISIPIVLNYLGVEKYGVWSTILTILSWIGYFDIGIGNGLRNRLTESLSKRDGKSKKLISSAYAFIAVIMIVATIIFSAAASFVNWNRIFGVSDIEENLAGVVIISVAFVATNFILSICKNVLYALQKAANVSIMELATQILNLGGVLVVMQTFGQSESVGTVAGLENATTCKGSLFLMAVVYGMSMILVNLVASIIIYSQNRDVRPRFRDIDITVGKSLTNLGLQFFLIQICALVLFTTDSLIISYLYGAAEVTPYNTVNKLFNVIIGVYSALIAPIWSAVTKAKAEQKYKELKSLIKRLYMLIGLFSMCALVLMVVFRPLTRIWLGQELAYTNALIGFGYMYCVLNMWTNMHGSLANGLGILKQQMVMAVAQATVNIPLSIFFAVNMNLGSAGILLGTNCALLISSIILPIIIHKSINSKGVL